MDPSIISGLSNYLIVMAEADGLQDPRVSTLLGAWAISSPLARRRFNDTVALVQPALLSNTTESAVRQYAEHLMPPLGVVELITELKAPKGAWDVLSQYFSRRAASYTARYGSRFVRPICSRDDFHREWFGPIHPPRRASAGPSSPGRAT